MRRERGATDGAAQAQQAVPAPRRLRPLELVAAVASLVTCVAAGMPWFGLPGVAFTGLSVHGYLTIPILAALALVAVVAVRLAWETPPFWLAGSRPPPLLALAVVEVVFIAVGFLIKPVGLRWQSGAYLALGAAFVAAVAIMVQTGRTRTRK